MGYMTMTRAEMVAGSVVARSPGAAGPVRATRGGSRRWRRARLGGVFPLLALLLASTAVAQAPAGGLAVARTAADGLVTELDVNGLKVLLKQREGSQTVVAGLYLRGGARNVTAQNAGIESLMLEAATEASESFPREQFRRELARTGTEISSSVGFDYSALTLRSTRLHFDRSWEIFADAALHPSFDPADFTRVKNRIMAARSSEQDSPDSYLQALQTRAAFAGHPYANDPRGDPASLGRLTVEDVRRYHQQAMQTSRLLLVIVGDLEPADVRRRVEASLGRLPRGEYRPDPIPGLTYTAPTLSVTPSGIVTNYVQGIYSAPPLNSDDYYAMRVATSILQSRVFEEVRERRNLSYAPDAFLWSRGANAGGIYVTADDANQAVAVMQNEILRLQRQPISPQSLTAITQHFLTLHYLRQETSAAQAGELALYELIGGGWRNAELFLDRLRAVTPSDVQRVANQYMRNLQFVVLGNPSSIDRGVFVGGPVR
jgi:zinc protease